MNLKSALLPVLFSLVALAQAPASPPLLGQGLVIADAGNHRLVELDAQGKLTRILELGAPFRYTDDVFFAPDGRYAYVTDPDAHIMGKVRYPQGQSLWRYGQPGVPGHTLDRLNRPDDLVPLPSGLLAVADIRNCRVLLLSPEGKLIRVLGKTGVCRNADGYFNKPNGAFPLGRDRLIVTEIVGHRLAITDLYGRRLQEIPLPLSYPSDANYTPWGSILVVDWSNPGAVLEVSLKGKVLWKYAPTDAQHRLDHPSVALGLPSGKIVLTDDRRHRVLVVDRSTRQVVFQYGQTDRPGSKPGLLRYPDGMDLIPAPVH